LFASSQTKNTLPFRIQIRCTDSPANFSLIRAPSSLILASTSSSGIITLIFSAIFFSSVNLYFQDSPRIFRHLAAFADPVSRDPDDVGAVRQQAQPLPFPGRNLFIHQVGLQLLPAVLPVDLQVVSGGSSPDYQTLFYF